MRDPQRTLERRNPSCIEYVLSLFARCCAIGVQECARSRRKGNEREIQRSTDYECLYSFLKQVYDSCKLKKYLSC